MNKQDIRWEQRFVNYNKAAVKLTEIVDTLNSDWNEEDISKGNFPLSELEIEGVIQRFEYTHELACNERLFRISRK